MKAFRVIALLVLVASSLVALALVRPHLPAAERGRRLAERVGCFGCHGPEGSHGAANPGRKDGTVPNYEGDLMMFAESPDEIREWIRDGATADRRASEAWRNERRHGVLKMPAFKRRLSERQIDDLVAFVVAVSSPVPEDSLAARGLARAEALGCTGCHGAGGRLARPNRGSFKGYIPSWDSADFPELVRDEDEFREWVERGVSRRFERNRLARVFLKRAAVKMPAYRDHLEPGDVETLWGYVRWLREHAGPRDTSS